MHRHYKILFCHLAACLLICVSFAHCFAGAWTCEEGSLYNRLAFNYYHADEQFDKEGDHHEFGNNGDFRDFNIQYYFEYGLWDDLTLISSLYYKDLEKEDDTKDVSNHGIGDIDLALKYRLMEGPGGVLSTQGLVKIPEAYDEGRNLPLGNGQYDFELKLLYGRSLWPIIPGYLNSEIGYRFRAQDPADELRYLIEFGMDFTAKIYGRIKLDGIEGMNNGSDSNEDSNNPSMAYNFDLGKLDMALGYKISPKWAVELGFVPEIYGKNTSAGASYSLALVYMIGKTP
jgi:protein XagA